MNTQKLYRFFFHMICLELVLTLTVGSVHAGPTQQTEADFAAIDAYVQEQMEDLGIPGMALGIMQDGQIAHLKGFGVADSSGRAVTPKTPFYIGSVTKSFTALAVMQLVEAGKIDLDAPVQKYLPWFELADKDASAKITVRNLLNQTSGISPRDGMGFWASQQGLEEVVRGLKTIQLTQPVRTTFQYSNINYTIAGLIVEEVSGQSYGDYVSQHIFEPLDMYHSYASRELALADGLSDGHLDMFGRAFRSERGMPAPYLPTGGLISSAEDMSRYLIAQLNDGRYGDVKLLSAKGIAELHTPAIPFGEGYYAMGWTTAVMDGVTLVNHNGDAGNFHTLIMLIPEQNSGFVLLSNASGFEQRNSGVVEQISLGIYNILNDKPVETVSVSLMMRFLYWSIVVVPAMQILGIAFVWRKREQMKTWGVVLTVILNFAVALFLFGYAQMEMPLRSLLVVNPELGYIAIAVAVIGIGWSAIYTAVYLRKRSVK